MAALDRPRFGKENERKASGQQRRTACMSHEVAFPPIDDRFAPSMSFSGELVYGSFSAMESFMSFYTNPVLVLCKRFWLGINIALRMNKNYSEIVQVGEMDTLVSNRFFEVQLLRPR